MWRIIVYGLFGIRKRWIFWIVIPVATLLMLRMGYKDAGYYRQYSAGSILSPDRYHDTAGSIIYGDGTGLNASQLNDALGEMRGENMPAFLFFLFLLILAIGAAYVASFCYANVYTDIDDVLDDEEARNYFVRRYEEAVGPYSPSGFSEEKFRFKLANFIYSLVIAENWRLLLADAPESFIAEIAAPIHSEQDEGFGKALKLLM